MEVIINFTFVAQKRLYNNAFDDPLNAFDDPLNAHLGWSLSMHLMILSDSEKNGLTQHLVGKMVRMMWVRIW